MLVGYNTNISYKGNVYHVQTEDNGQSNPVIVTLLYAKGAILASKKTNYAHALSEPDYRERVRTIMKEQHKIMIKELISGKYTGDVDTSGTDAEQTTDTGTDNAVQTRDVNAKDTEQPPKSLDDVLLNYILKRAKK